MSRATCLLLCAVLSIAGCRSQRSENMSPEGGIPREAGPVLAPSGPATPFLRLLDVGGILDAHHQVWLWPAPFGLTHAVRVTGLEDVQNVMGLEPWLCALLGTGKIRCIVRPEPAAQLAAQQACSTDAGAGCTPDRFALSGLDGEFREIDGDCLFRTDETIWCWRPVAPHVSKYELVQMLGIADVAHVVGSCALHHDGGVSCWGDSQKHDTHLRVRGLSDIVEIAGGTALMGGFTCARKRDGTVWCWGANEHGQLGIMRGMFHADPVQVPGIDDALAVAAGAQHACALRSDRRVWCWGSNDFREVQPDASWEANVPLCRDDTCATPRDGSCVRLKRPALTFPLPDYIRCPTPRPMPGLSDVTQLGSNAISAIVGDRRVIRWGHWWDPTSRAGIGNGMPREVSWSVADVDAGGQ